MSVKTLAAAALRKHGGDVEKALVPFVRAVKAANLINDLAREYLEQVVTLPSGQGTRPTRNHTAGLSPSSGSIKVREHDVRQHRRRTHDERMAALAAAATSIEAVFEIEIGGRAIGNIQIGELTSLRRSLVEDATGKLLLGMEQARAAVLAELIQNHCQAVDQLSRVREVVDARTLKALVAQADEEAPRRVTEGIKRASAAIENRELAS